MTRSEYHRKWKKDNPDKVRAYSRAEYRRNPAKHRDKALRRKFGITLEKYNAMLAEQKGRCAICYTDQPGGKGTFHVDHHHGTGAVRGLLCQNCNIGLGSFQDDAVLLEEAAIYLRSRKPVTGASE